MAKLNFETDCGQEFTVKDGYLVGVKLDRQYDCDIALIPVNELQDFLVWLRDEVHRTDRERIQQDDT